MLPIFSFQKSSILDFPGKIVAIVWISGCNFRCPFCYNREIVENIRSNVSEDEIIEFLKKRRKILDGISITGGEPLLHFKELVNFLEKIRETLGKDFLIKIDTNGYFPKELEYLIDNNLVDYVAMDIKTIPEKYNIATGVKVDFSRIEKSISIIIEKMSNYEFRTTVVPKIVDLPEDPIYICENLIRGAKKYVLQQFVPKNCINKEFEKLKPYSKEEILKTANIIRARKLVKQVVVRNI